MFSYISPEDRVPPDHPLRPIRALVRDGLKAMSPTFSRLYAREGRPGIPRNNCSARSSCRCSIPCAPSGS